MSGIAATEPRTGHLDVDGTRLEYAWHGPGPETATTLVLLHEGLGCVALWKDFPAALAAATGMGVFVYSRAGYGASDPVPLPRPVEYMHVEGRDVLPAVLAEAGVKRAILVGHSDGGSIALVHAGGVAPFAGLLGLALFSPHVCNEQACVDSIRAAGEAYRVTDLRARLARYHGDNVDVAFRGWNDVWLHPDFWHWNIESFLPAIRVPTLVIQGEDDEYGTARQYESIRANAGGPVEVLTLPDCRHSPHFDRPEATLAAVVEFARRLDGDAAPATT